MTSRLLKSVGRSAHSTGRLGTSELAQLALPLPPTPEQREIAAACDAKIAALEREIALHEELFRALLEELRSGRLAVQPLLEGTAA